ncbi:MAG: M6 family metalloprotease domain-containing protein [Bacteroidales bacterium]|nr:M6 family metalloprotease domain-containing protein [Bacteroidales bacterium]
MIAALLPLLAAAQGFRAVVIPVEFGDESFKDKNKNVVEKIASARNYFNDQFSPSRSFSFDLLPTVKLSKDLSWYGANSSSVKDCRANELIRDACAALKNDLSVYDNDGDGSIDNICIIAAGGSEADGAGVDCIWPQQLSLKERGESFVRDGKTVDSASICVEGSGLGTFCHEFAHSLGLQDLYDTDGNGSGGTAPGLLGTLSLMDKGSKNDGGNTPPNFCAIELEQLGLGKQVELKRGFHRLHPVGESKEYLRIDTPNPDEYFLLECRSDSGWDAFIGGRGLLVYHIDRSANNSWYSDYYRRNLTARERWANNQVNCRPDHQCARLLAATPGTSKVSEVFFPLEGRTAISAETDPSLKFWSGATSSLAIDHITLESDGSVSFNVITPVVVRESLVYQDAAIFSWSVDNTLSVEDCSVGWFSQGDKSYAGTGSCQASRLQDGSFTATLEGLSPSTPYTLQIKLTCKDGSAHSYSMDFVTKSRPEHARPFIYLKSLSKREDGTYPAGERIPLRVYNATGAKQVQWFFDDIRIAPGLDGFWYLQTSGTLKAWVWYEDGSKDVIIKKMNVR